MGRQIVLNKKTGKFNLYSTIIDNWLFNEDLTKEEMIGFLGKEAYDDAVEKASEIVAEIEIGVNPYKKYGWKHNSYEEFEKNINES